ncbi:hypothetical protein LINGRAHAP2_LOCUS36573, partial [Linum grandiflorum]
QPQQVGSLSRLCVSFPLSRLCVSFLLKHSACFSSSSSLRVLPSFSSFYCLLPPLPLYLFSSLPKVDVMTKELEKQLSNFHLSEEEINIIKVEKDDVDDTTVEVVEELGAIGFLQGSKSPGIKFLKSALSTAWKPKQEFDIQQIKECLFAFQFFNDEDRRKALCGGPWNFDNRLMVLKPIERDKDVEEIDFSMTEMWIRIRKIPLKLRTSKIAKKIGAMFGSLKLFDKENSGVWSNYMRIRVEVNVKKPLRRGVLLEVDNENVWFKIAYERLPIFCYNCGLLGHIQKECEMERVPEDEQQYGGWLRALSPLKRIGAKNSTEATKIAALWSSVKQRKSSVRTPARPTTETFNSLKKIKRQRRLGFLMRRLEEGSSILSKSHPLSPREKATPLMRLVLGKKKVYSRRKQKREVV